MFFLKILLSLAVYLLTPFLLSPLLPDSISPLVFGGLCALVVQPLLLLLYVREQRLRGISHRLPEHAGQLLPLVLVFGAAVCLAANNLLALSGISQFFTGYEEVAKTLFSPPLLQQLLFVGLIIPFTEELIFRGQAYALLRDRMPWLPAALLSALLFGIFHGNATQGIYGFVLGIILAWLYEVSGGLLMPYLFHAAANIMSSVVTAVNWGDAPWYTLPVFMAETGITLGISWICLMSIRKISRMEDYHGRRTHS